MPSRNLFESSFFYSAPVVWQSYSVSIVQVSQNDQYLVVDGDGLAYLLGGFSNSRNPRGDKGKMAKKSGVWEEYIMNSSISVLLAK